MLQCRCRTQALWKFDISPKPSARRAGEVQCLGGMPWVPGDCDRARHQPSDAKTGESQYRRLEPATPDDRPRFDGRPHWGAGVWDFSTLFPFERGQLDFENFTLKPSSIPKLRRTGFGKPYAIALHWGGGGKRASSPPPPDRLFLSQARRLQAFT